jgi:hypothetical protein
MEEGLRRDTPAKGADTAGIHIQIDQSDLKPQIRGPKGRRITAGTGADNDELG